MAVTQGANSPATESSSPDTYGDDLRDLRTIVGQLKDFVGAIVEDGRYVPGRERERVKSAWDFANADFARVLERLDTESLVPEH